MKFALVFVLLIGISCQIRQGDCAPDGIYESLSGMVSGAYSLTQNTYDMVVDNLSPLTNYLPSAPDSLTSYLPSAPDSLMSYLPSLPSVPSVTNSLTDSLSDIKESTENLGSEAGDMLKSGVEQINDAVGYN